MLTDNTIIEVRRQWNDWRVAKVRFQSLSRFHLSYSSGGVGARSPRPFMHAYMYCDQVVEGELPHSGRHGGPCPHSIKVCIVKKDNDPKIIAELLKLIDSSSGA